MHQIDTSNAASSPPTPGAPGTAGWFGNGTIVDDDWLNAVQGELLNVLTVAGTAPSKTNNTQVLASLVAIFAQPPTWLPTSGTVTVPSWATRALISAWGGGGGGGAGLAGNAGAGGDGGGYAETIISVTPNATLSFAVGAGGAGGSGAGSAGGATSFAGTTLATGGGGGGAASSGSVGIAAYAPGAGSGTLLAQSGFPGQNGLQIGGEALGGSGGGTPFGAPQTLNPAASGAAVGHFPGGGGSGAAGAGNGGAGASGAIKLRWLP